MYADSGSNITSSVAAINNSTVACDYCLFQGPGATSFTNLTSSGGRALSPGTSSGSGGSNLSGGAIAGIIIGALAGVALVALLAWLLLRRRKKAADKKDVEMAKPEKPQVTSAKNRLPPGAMLSKLLSSLVALNPVAKGLTHVSPDACCDLATFTSALAKTSQSLPYSTQLR